MKSQEIVRDHSGERRGIGMNYKKTAAVLAACLLTGAGSAFAENAAPVFALQGITVTATRQAESL